MLERVPPFRGDDIKADRLHLPDVGVEIEKAEEEAFFGSIYESLNPVPITVPVISTYSCPVIPVIPELLHISFVLANVLSPPILGPHHNL